MQRFKIPTLHSFSFKFAIMLSMLLKDVGLTLLLGVVIFGFSPNDLVVFNQNPEVFNLCSNKSLLIANMKLKLNVGRKRKVHPKKDLTN